MTTLVNYPRPLPKFNVMAAAWAIHRTMLARFGEDNFRQALKSAWYQHRETMKKWLRINEPALSYEEQREINLRNHYRNYTTAEIMRSIELRIAEQEDIWFTYQRYTPRYRDLDTMIADLRDGLKYAKDQASA